MFFKNKLRTLDVFVEYYINLNKPADECVEKKEVGRQKEQIGRECWMS
jgi:hypothetical protein